MSTLATPVLSMDRVSNAPIVNGLSIDVEDYFQVSAFAPHVERDRWDSMECRIEGNIERILGLLSAANVRATFFTLGWVAERYPALVRRLGDAGHEIASHGFEHRRASEQSPEAFLADIRLAKAILEDVSGREVRGYRAPSFSIGSSNRWAFEAIAEAGYRYSSSIYPIRHDHYGDPEAPRFAHEVQPGLLEVPVSTVRILRTNLPAGGGGYFRLLPYAVSRWSIAQINGRERQPAIFYFHPWELDPEQPRVSGVDFRSRFRHYVNLRRMAPRLGRLLFQFQWDRVDRVILDGVA
jgi:polysaccharide deacetylase family protein (PEP-CTERM system associated)